MQYMHTHTAVRKNHIMYAPVIIYAHLITIFHLLIKKLRKYCVPITLGLSFFSNITNEMSHDVSYGSPYYELIELIVNKY